ncbi:GGDEF domain-containing protein [Thauera aminoaromatica]|uniref:diguanylate cyclase n=1 Tax=Thauera aminoaromatica TaxID=164330 RepID=A0A5C7S894_THASP|nr:GGDEF domain-containing protein [Thauera aminoaromatica]TXH78851.1 MAG: GGDEF domain-containing protein [Thauera aminoaromatica]
MFPKRAQTLRPKKMIDTTQPSDIARETLRQLALRRIAPTPDNYRALYHEIAGTPPDEVFPERALRQLAAALPRHNREALRIAQDVESAIGTGDWAALRGVLVTALSATDSPELNLGALLRDLITEWDRRHAGLTQARKREMLDRVLSASGTQTERLVERLTGMLRSWSRNGDDELPGGDAATPPAAMATAAPSPLPTTNPLFAELLVLLLDGIATHAQSLEPGIADEALALAEAVRSTPPPLGPDQLLERLQALRARLDWATEDQQAVREALQRVLQLILENISELVVEDRWLHGQMVLMGELFCRPLDVRLLGELEVRLRDVILRQTSLKHELDDAQTRLKEMLKTFVDRLGEFADSTGDYHARIEESAGRIAAARDIAELTDVIADVMRETRAVQESTQRSRGEIEELRQQASHANAEIARLQAELEQTSELIRHDPLTGMLNRKGLDEALSREAAFAQRRGTPLCLGLLDVDNFKQINDTHGHQTGDEALQHLATVIRENVRPQDSVGRYGGEEFVVLLPDTALDSAAAALVRLQRALTKRFFLARQQKLLITFSAGVAQLRPDEQPEHAVDRADKAMYIAKRSGKNRVISAP